MSCAVRKPRTLHAHNDIHGMGVMLALGEQDVRLCCCVFEFEGVIMRAWYSVWSRKFTLVCYFVVQIHYNGDDDSAFVDLRCLNVCMQRVGSARSARTFVFLAAVYLNFKGDYKVFDAVWGRNLILVCCPKYTTMAMTTLRWSSLNVWNGGVVLVLHNQHVR